MDQEVETLKVHQVGRPRDVFADPIPQTVLLK